jgi:hypothetical protein
LLSQGCLVVNRVFFTLHFEPICRSTNRHLVVGGDHTSYLVKTSELLDHTTKDREKDGKLQFPWLFTLLNNLF